MGNLRGKNLVEGGGKAFTGRLAIVRHVFRAIRNPDIRDHWRADLPRDFFADLAAGDTAIDPESADRVVRMREREAVAG